MKPLTIDELNALQVGDWVWVVDEDFKDGRYREITIQNEIEPTLFYVSSYSNPAKVYNYSDYGKTWLAYKNKEQTEAKGDLYQTAFELILQDVYENRLQADILSCSSCPFMFELFDGFENQGLYEDCKKRWQDYYLSEAERRLAELKGEKL